MLVRLFIAISKKSGKVYFKHLLFMFLCAVPTLIYIFLQFAVYFIFSGSYGADDSSLIFTKFGEVWGVYSDNIPLSILLGMAFPIYMVLADTKFFLKDDQGKLALTTYAIGFLQAMFLAESGGKIYHADFIWPMMSGMLLMHAVSLMRLVYLENTVNGKRGKIVIAGGWVMFIAHVLCGVLFLRV